MLGRKIQNIIKGTVLDVVVKVGLFEEMAYKRSSDGKE